MEILPYNIRFVILDSVYIWNACVYIFYRGRIGELEKVRDNLIKQKEELLVSIDHKNPKNSDILKIN